MKIKKVIIDNFRNIEHAEYELEDMNIFAGPNGTGKSNTLLAIYWMLNDYLLDGSSDDASNKPFEREHKTKTSVYLEFEDGWDIKREYSENWVKKRGSAEVVMEGNVTQYYIRGDKVNIKEARKQLQERLGLNVNTNTSAFNLSLALTDPSYIGSKIDATTLRSYIIELCGDVSNEDVFKIDPMFETVRNNIAEYDGDPSLVIKALKKKIKACKDEINGKEGAIETLKETKDVTAEELKEAENMIYKINDNISIYRQQKVTFVNKRVDDLEKKLSAAKLKLSEQIAKDTDHMTLSNSDINRSIELKRDEYARRKKELDTLNNEYFSMDKQKRIFAQKMETLQKEKAEKELRLSKCREEYGDIVKMQFVNNIIIPEEVKCPECGYLLNSDVMDSIRQNILDNERKFAEDKAARLSANVKEGKTLKLDIDNIALELDEINAANEKYDLTIIEKQIDDKNKELKIVEEEGNVLKEKLITSYESSETKSLRAEVNLIETELEKERQSDNSMQDIEDKILKCMEERKQYDDVVARHDAFEQIQNEVYRITKDIEVIAVKQTAYEQDLSVTSDFMKAKLSMLNKNVEKVFGTRVQFTLVKANIKEGSWEEVCFASVLDKKTPFIRGSESERIRTGIYMIECIKKRMQLNDVPIIFDRSNDLDSQNLKNLGTNAQIITTRVDDVHYDKVTLVHE